MDSTLVPGLSNTAAMSGEVGMIVNVKFDLPAEAVLIPVIRCQVDALLQHMGVTEDDVYRAGIVVTEACSNVVRHAYAEPGQRYRVELEYHAERLVVTVTDFGRGFDACDVPEPSLGQIGGYGIYFMRESADKLEFSRPGGTGTRIEAEICLHYRSDEALDFARELDRS
ncbi:MAG TPA: ATP-binding protein [Armatimonadota bacterium]|nr:ATP-binding protein [Armatimonadota bacterium]